MNHVAPKKRPFEANRFRLFSAHNLDKIDQIHRLPQQSRREIEVVSHVLPFRVNNYVIDQLIDWERIPQDPVFQLTFPQREMLEPEDYDRLERMLSDLGAKHPEFEALVHEVRNKMNPHPAGQLQLNVPVADGEPLPGTQHKYPETVLFFPSQGQVCHAYCTFCFRWAQFVGEDQLLFAANEVAHLVRYLRNHQEVSDLLLTGGDPMVMKIKWLEHYLRPLLAPELKHVRNIRIGTKALSYWPQRFVTDSDADDVLRLFERIVKSGRHLSIMAHINHWQEMSTPLFEKAVKRIRQTGAEIRTQSPILAHINDDSDVWRKMWTQQVNLGLVPYYAFVERDTGAKRYFEVPLYRAWEIYRDAIRHVSGLCRTSRGPSMSAGPGKVEIQGITEIKGEKVFVLRFIQGRNPEWVQQPFFAAYDEKATWLDDLTPAFGEKHFFFEEAYQKFVKGSLVW
jgi:KamA family protein